MTDVCFRNPESDKSKTTGGQSARIFPYPTSISPRQNMHEHIRLNEHRATEREIYKSKHNLSSKTYDAPLPEIRYNVVHSHTRGLAVMVYSPDLFVISSRSLLSEQNVAARDEKMKQPTHSHTAR